MTAVTSRMPGTELMISLVYSSGRSRMAMRTWPVVSALWSRRSATVSASSATMRAAGAAALAAAVLRLRAREI